ncbi:MAG TPA: hypothetical protein VE569_12350 [Acidimicrobiia bacterium]|nr:hypothetical protein [Acidimicrobiia bacterium]
MSPFEIALADLDVDQIRVVARTFPPEGAPVLPRRWLPEWRRPVLHGDDPMSGVECAPGCCERHSSLSKEEMVWVRRATGPE